MKQVWVYESDRRDSMPAISTLRHRSHRSVLVENLLRYLSKNFKSSSKAFIITYLYIIIPKLLSRIIKIISNHKYFESKEWLKVQHMLRNALKRDKLPAFMFKLIFTLNSIDPVLNLFLLKFTKNANRARLISIFVSSLASASINFPKFQRQVITKHRFYSLDLSLFIIVRSFDALTTSLFDRYSVPTSVFDVGSFMTCAFLIMHSWFYYPESLPPAYRNWITKAANMDYDLIKALRLLHHEQLFYGKTSPNDDVLIPLCERIGIDPKLGNPATTFPIPCDIVHANLAHNCEVHALIRLFRGFKFASEIYIPLNAILLLISILSGRQRNVKKLILKSTSSAIRSSSFLAFFIALNWYPICLVRNRVGPFIYSRWPNLIDKNFDKSLAPTMGCLASGLSSIIETSKRRRDLTLFCAPKALLTVIPLEPSVKNLHVESCGFSLFFAILVCYSKLAPDKVKGVYGRGLNFLLKE